MTLPDQPGGTSLDFDLLGSLFGVSGNDGSIPFLSELTQPFVEGFLKQSVQDSPGWLGANDAAYSGLLPGIALIPNLLMNIVTTIIGLPFGTWPGTGPGGFLGEIPNILSDLGNFFFNLTGLFGGDVDLNSLIFDPIEAIFNFVSTMIVPTDLLASLIDGFIPGLQIPGLDASKIISGEFPMEMITGLLDMFADIPLIGPFVQAITGILDGDLSDLTSFFTGFGGAGSLLEQLVGSITGGSGSGGLLDLSSFFSGFGAGGSLLEQLVSSITGGDGAGGLADLIGFGFLGGDSPLNAFNLFNIIPSNLLGLIGFGQIGDTQPNLLANGTFESAVSVSGSGIWTWDGTTGRTANGCASVNANGSEQRLLSNAIPVAEGDKLSHIIRAKWSGLAYTGTPFRTRMVRMLNHAQVGIDNLAAPSAPGTNQTTWVDLTGADYTVPAGCDAVCYELTITATATAGNIKFDDGEVRKTGLLQMPWMQDLPESLADLLAFGQSTLDTIFEGITGFSQIGTLLSDVLGALQNIPGPNVGGLGGPANIVDTAQATWDQWIGGLVGVLGSGSGLADLFNIGQDISSRASRGAMAFDTTAIRSNKSLNTGFLPTTQSNISLDKIALQSVAPTFGITQSTAITSYQRISESGLKGVVSWQGYGVTNVTHCFVNIYKMDTVNGDNDLVHESANIVGSLTGGATPVPVVYSFTPIQTEPGEVYGIEVAIRGTGTHNIAGAPSWLADQTVYPRRYSSVRDSGTSAAPSNYTPTYGTNVAFIEFGVSASDVAIPHAPQLQQINTSQSYPIPDWANFVDRIAVGGGGAGHVGGTWGISGKGGEAGIWASDTRSKASGHFTTGQSVTITIPAAAAGGSGNGADGGNVTAALNGNTLSATGGQGADDYSVGGDDKNGRSPGNHTYDGQAYAGGSTQSTFGANGSAPGGGGAGGNYVSFQHGGDGALGRVWLRFRQ